MIVLTFFRYEPIHSERLKSRSQVQAESQISSWWLVNVARLLITFSSWQNLPSLLVFVSLGYSNPGPSLNPLSHKCTEFRSVNPENLRARHQTSMAEMPWAPAGQGRCSMYAESVSCVYRWMAFKTRRFEENRNSAYYLITFNLISYTVVLKMIFVSPLKRLHFWELERSLNDLQFWLKIR